MQLNRELTGAVNQVTFNGHLLNFVSNREFFAPQHDELIRTTTSKAQGKERDLLAQALERLYPEQDEP